MPTADIGRSFHDSRATQDAAREGFQRSVSYDSMRNTRDSGTTPSCSIASAAAWVCIKGHHAVHVGNVHQQGHPIGLLRVDKGANVGYAERPKNLFAPGRVEPVFGVFLDVMVDNDRRH